MFLHLLDNFKNNTIKTSAMNAIDFKNETKPFENNKNIEYQSRVVKERYKILVSYQGEITSE